jgi:hypothetical protein
VLNLFSHQREQKFEIIIENSLGPTALRTDHCVCIRVCLWLHGPKRFQTIHFAAEQLRTRSDCFPKLGKELPIAKPAYKSLVLQKAIKQPARPAEHCLATTAYNRFAMLRPCVMPLCGKWGTTAVDAVQLWFLFQ